MILWKHTSEGFEHSKLPPEIKLIISRETTGERWHLSLRILEREVNARERTTSATSIGQRRTQPRVPTAATLTTSSSANTTVSCTYCGGNHSSVSCSTMTDISARMEMLRKAGRCYVCLRKNHMSRVSFKDHQQEVPGKAPCVYLHSSLHGTRRSCQRFQGITPRIL